MTPSWSRRRVRWNSIFQKQRLARTEIADLLNILGPLVEDVQHAREKEEQLVAELEYDEDDF